MRQVVSFMNMYSDLNTYSLIALAMTFVTKIAGLSFFLLISTISYGQKEVSHWFFGFYCDRFIPIQQMAFSTLKCYKAVILI